MPEIWVGELQELSVVIPSQGDFGVWRNKDTTMKWQP